MWPINDIMKGKFNMTLEERNKHILENKIISTDYPISPRFRDLCGRDINGIKILSYVGKDKELSAYYKCICRCGNSFIAKGSLILRGFTRSCGCYRGNMRTRNSFKTSNDPIYTIYHRIRDIAFVDESVTICEDWIDKSDNNGFDNFRNWIVENGFKRGYTILRKNPAEPYCPSNCILVDSTLSQVFKSNGHYIELDGYKYPLSIWAKIVKNDQKLISIRIRQGWSEREAVLTPKYGKRGIDIVEYTIPPEIARLNGCVQ